MSTNGTDNHQAAIWQTTAELIAEVRDHGGAVSPVAEAVVDLDDEPPVPDEPPMPDEPMLFDTPPPPPPDDDSGAADDGWLSPADEVAQDHPTVVPEAVNDDTRTPATLEEALADQGLSPAQATAPPRFNKKVAAVFGGVVVALTVALTVALLAMRSGPQVAEAPLQPITQLSVVPAPPAADPVDDIDGPIPYRAEANCPPGSTSAQAVATDDPTQAWVCVRGGADGQVLHLDLGQPMIVTAVSITPGWVGTDSAGTDQWLQHRVATRVQWIFDDAATTVLPQDTKNIRGEAIQALPERGGKPGGVVATKVTLVILQSSRPPADAPAEPTPGPSDPANPFGTLPGLTEDTFTNPATGTGDPVDNTVAVSSIKILGHPPLR